MNSSVKEVRSAISGGAFILDTPPHVPAVWGADEQVLWSQGEALMLVSSPGVGKSTMLGQLALRRCGVKTSNLLGLPVNSGSGRTLLVIADRPKQGARSLRRMVSEADRDLLNERLAIHPGPLPFDLASCEPGALLKWIRALGEDITTVGLDSLGALATRLADDEPGARVGAEIARVIAADIEVVVNHHQRKAVQGAGKEPRGIDDVYGSTWLTSNMGSVLYLSGQPGDLILQARHLKKPSEEVGPLKLRLTPETGGFDLYGVRELSEIVAEAGGEITVKAAAQELFGTPTPTENEIEKARRRLAKEPALDRLNNVEKGGPTRFRLSKSVTPRDPSRDPLTLKVTQPHESLGQASRDGHGPSHPNSEPSAPPFRGAGAESVTPNQNETSDAGWGAEGEAPLEERWDHLSVEGGHEPSPDEDLEAFGMFLHDDREGALR